MLLAIGPDGRFAAVKLVHGFLAHDPVFRERFRREIAACRLVSGAYTAPVLDADADAPTPWLATLYVPGPSLRNVVTATVPGSSTGTSNPATYSSPTTGPASSTSASHAPSRTTMN